ncbi:DUF2256 domain-containing protein [Microbacterium sp. NPDC086615]|uniref:DUF2256 domain-containing protein n=1 Tax=Microbacterium sp. NPDC086615 TaxID=3154865 RepID=UPI003442638A
MGAPDHEPRWARAGLARTPRLCQRKPPQFGVAFCDDDAMSRPEVRSKPCAYCGRPFTDRKRWSGRDQWDEVLYCSRGCRANAAKRRRRA